MDAPITDPTLSAYHAPLAPHERVFFASYLDDDTGDTRLLLVTKPADARPAELITTTIVPDGNSLPSGIQGDSEQGDG